MTAAFEAELRSRDVREASELEELRRQVERAQGQQEELALELKRERRTGEELERKKEVFSQQLEAAEALLGSVRLCLELVGEAELVKEHGRAFDLKARALRA